MMLVSKVRNDGVFDGFVEFPDGTTRIPPGHSFSLPPEIPEGYYALMMGGWKLIEGEKPFYPVPPSEQELFDRTYEKFNELTQLRLDDFAKTRGYSSILSACSYVNSTIEKFRIEAEYCVSSRDATWMTLYNIMEEVKDKTRPFPTNYESIELELPVLQWPN
jgi:hypothetical protein